MEKLSISKEQYSDLVNLCHGVFNPLNKFVNKREFISIIKKKKFNNFYFTFPIYFGIRKNEYKELKNIKILDLYFKGNFVAKISIKNFFKIDHKFFGNKIYGKKFYNHPYYKKFKRDNFIFLDFSFLKISKKNCSPKYFTSPKNFKNFFKRKNKIKILAGFHTRNVPHTGHEWIHNSILKNYGALLIQPLIGQYKSGEYKEKIIIKSNLEALKMYNTNKAFFTPFFSYPRYAGPLEAALHAIVRRNYGCTHFWVGRDHAGFKNFFKIYASQNFCKKNQKKLKIKIIAQKEPRYCYGCEKISNKCISKNCMKSKKEKISGTKVRKYIILNKKVPEFLLNPIFAKKLNKTSLIK
tara:strand:- start:292 stop:1347 length:1056 start_codon:yes stop_codon:yes gene_type:complete